MTDDGPRTWFRANYVGCAPNLCALCGHAIETYLQVSKHGVCAWCDKCGHAVPTKRGKAK